MLDIKPCLWFHAEAEEAAKYYVSIFPDSKIGNTVRGVTRLATSRWPK